MVKYIVNFRDKKSGEIKKEITFKDTFDLKHNPHRIVLHAIDICRESGISFSPRNTKVSWTYEKE